MASVNAGLRNEKNIVNIFQTFSKVTGIILTCCLLGKISVVSLEASTPLAFLEFVDASGLPFADLVPTELLDLPINKQ